MKLHTHPRGETFTRPASEDGSPIHYRPGELELMTELTDAVRELRDTMRGQRGVQLSGATPVTLPGSGSATGATSAKLATSACRWVGVNLRETTGTGTALVEFRDGDDQGDVIMSFSLAANESVRDWFGAEGIGCAFGLYGQVVSGVVAVHAFLGGRR